MVFRHTLTANENYPVQDIVTLSSPIQMQLSFKPIIFSDLFLPFLESESNFNYFEKKDASHTYFISEISECEKVGWITL